MYVVSVMYPRADVTSRFALDHYVHVHLKLGFGLMRQHFGIAPIKAMVQHTTEGMDGAEASAPYMVICWVVFKSRSDAQLFASVFAIKEAGEALRNDWGKFCPVPPKIVFGEVIELSGREVLEGSEGVLADNGFAGIR